MFSANFVTDLLIEYALCIVSNFDSLLLLFFISDIANNTIFTPFLFIAEIIPLCFYFFNSIVQSLYYMTGHKALSMPDYLIRKAGRTPATPEALAQPAPPRPVTEAKLAEETTSLSQYQYLSPASFLATVKSCLCLNNDN